MGKVICILTLFALLLSGCSSTQYKAYYTVSVDNDTSVVSDGTYAYDMTEGVLSGRRQMFPSEWQPCLSFFPTGEPYILTELALCNYIGSLYDISNYRQSLLEDGYATCFYVADANYIDTKLEKDGHIVRIIYFSDGRIKILEGGEMR